MLCDVALLTSGPVTCVCDMHVRICNFTRRMLCSNRTWGLPELFQMSRWQFQQCPWWWSDPHAQCTQFLGLSPHPPAMFCPSWSANDASRAHCFVAVGLLKNFKGFHCRVPLFWDQIWCLFSALHKISNIHVHIVTNAGPDVDITMSCCILAHERYCSLLLHMQDHDVLRWFATRTISLNVLIMPRIASSSHM